MCVTLPFSIMEPFLPSTMSASIEVEKFPI